MHLKLFYEPIITKKPCFGPSRSRDRSVLVRGPWGETDWTLREEAQPGGRCGHRGEARRQDAPAAARQPQGQAESGGPLGRRGQGLVAVTCPPPSVAPVKLINVFH